jgi:ABC-type proline/glycine betaine transport system permease subunit
MKLPDKITTVAFWVVASGLAIIAAGDAIRIGVTRQRPWLVVGAVIVCVVAAFGVRECLRSIKRRNGSEGPGNAV